jgi:tetratricopeptide (TPR) repeat protein
MLKLAFFCRPAQEGFLRDTIDAFANKPKKYVVSYHITEDMELIQKEMKKADICWFEWCDALIMQASKLPTAKDKRIICRIHGYEVYGHNIRNTDWSVVDDLIFVTPHIRRIFEEKVDPKKRLHTMLHTIHCGIEPKHFPLKKRNDGLNLGFYGYLNEKKNIPLVLDILYSLNQRKGGYRLFLSGMSWDERLTRYVHYFKTSRKMEEEIIIDTMSPWLRKGWENPPEKLNWYNKINYYVSGSIDEGICYGAAESMLCGVKPILHNCEGLRDHYPPKYLYDTVDEAVDMILNGRYDSEEYRDYILDTYSIKKQVELTEAVIEGSAVGDAPAIETERKSGITLYMIVKNEERGIARAIESVKEAVDDIVVMVDDATKDQTRELAEECGARVYEYTWKKDFAWARNNALALVETEWGLVLDGHEYLVTDAKKLLSVVKEHSTASKINMTVRMEKDSSGNEKPFLSIRLHKVKNAKWTRKMHNILNVPGDLVDVPALVIKHDRYEGQSAESRAERDKQRDTDLVEGQMEEIKENPSDTRSMFYLAQQHRDAGRWEQALHWYERYTRTPEGRRWPEELFQAHYQAGRAAMALMDYPKAIEMADGAIKIMANRAEGWALRGDAHYKRGDFGEAYSDYKKASTIPAPNNAKLPVEESLHKGGWRILDQLAMACWRTKRYEEGQELCKALLDGDGLPENQRNRMRDNLKWHTDAISAQE